MTSNEPSVKRCRTCGGPMDVANDPRTRDCGGDCLRCMAEAGDPDCVAAFALYEALADAIDLLTLVSHGGPVATPELQRRRRERAFRTVEFFRTVMDGDTTVVCQPAKPVAPKSGATDAEFDRLIRVHENDPGFPEHWPLRKMHGKRKVMRRLVDSLDVKRRRDPDMGAQASGDDVRRDLIELLEDAGTNPGDAPEQADKWIGYILTSFGPHHSEAKDA